MEHLNKIELIGKVSDCVKTKINEMTHIKFSLAVQDRYYDTNGNPTYTTTWFPCTYFLNDKDNLEDFQKGKEVHIVGRLRLKEFTSACGNTMQKYEVFVTKALYEH